VHPPIRVRRALTHPLHRGLLRLHLLLHLRQLGAQLRGLAGLREGIGGAQRRGDRPCERGNERPPGPFRAGRTDRAMRSGAHANLRIHGETSARGTNGFARASQPPRVNEVGI